MALAPEDAASLAVERILVSANPRGMRDASACLVPGSCLRAARLLQAAAGPVFICTGFPVGESFETDGPVGALVLYRVLKACAGTPVLVCGEPLFSALPSRFTREKLPASTDPLAAQSCRALLDRWRPGLLLAVECPGPAEDGRCYNMRGKDITARAASVDALFRAADCPTVGVGDGGNEVGMGNLSGEARPPGIRHCVTPCAELVLADVSNWGVYGILGLLSVLEGRNFLREVDHAALLAETAGLGAVDGVTGEKTRTEDGFEASRGISLLHEIQGVCGFADAVRGG